jgi:hypothetical protein
MSQAQQYVPIPGLTPEVLLNWINSLENDICLLVSSLSDLNDGNFSKSANNLNFPIRRCPLRDPKRDHLWQQAQ